MFFCTVRALNKKDFDAWAYHIAWPQTSRQLPLYGTVDVAVEDIKFAYNAWSLLRIGMFFGLRYPKVLSSLTETRPPMDISFGGNRLFYLHTRVGQPLSPTSVKVALTPDHPKAVSVQQFPWRKVIDDCRQSPVPKSVEIVLGMENGLSESVASQCAHHVFIPQYGSIGSLSMLSALAIATHTAAVAAQAADGTHGDGVMGGSMGHMPLSNHEAAPPNPLPHETNFLYSTNEEIVEVLQKRRSSYPLQISLLVYNELGDRNIGAMMRNANAFNCEQMVILNRRRFNRRGAVGTNHILNTAFFESTEDPQCRQVLQEYEVWVLHQYYPYLHPSFGAYISCNDRQEDGTFVRHSDPALQQYLSAQSLGEKRPLPPDCARLLGMDVFLDDEAAVSAALLDVKSRGLRGVMLAVPEEGCVPHPQVLSVSRRVVHIVHPSRAMHKTQRGLNGALASAIALERIRTCIDNLDSVAEAKHPQGPSVSPVAPL